MPATKIATCCYCGTRAALVLRGTHRHELSCASCGAPLHELKGLRCDTVAARSQSPGRTTGADLPREHPARRGKKTGKRKKPKSLRRRMFSHAFDIIEDIFD